MSEYTVTEKAQRPASMNGRCFYCNQDVGSNHLDDCVLIEKIVKIKMTVEFNVKVPNCWGKDDVEFHRNESSWCASNAIDELSMIESQTGDCLCAVAHFEYLSDVSGAFLDEE